MTTRLALVWTVVLAGACGPGKETTTEDPTEDGSTSTTGEETSGDVPTDPSMPTLPTDPTEDGTTDGPNPTEPNTVALIEGNDVDILFVLDNSGSMAEEQAILADSIQALLDGLDGVNWRIGMTTTDAGNPRCPMSTPENGALVLSSCVDRVAQDQFVFIDQDFSAACTDRCAVGDAELVVMPTATEVDDNKVPRRWIERTNGVLNVEGADATAALQCYLPQGVAGCGFESHLQSMFRAVAGANDPGDQNNFGFVRAAAVLAVVMVSDETDCSFAAAHSDIFIDNKVFWEDPDAVAPTSAMCWNAGVACTGNAPTWAECHAENWDAVGMVTDAEADAVLQPVSGFVEFLQQVEDQKKQFQASAEVLVAMITGVPPGYDTFDAELVFEDSPDPEFQSLFGIGPGCIAGDPNSPQTAVPPVREREWAEAFATEGGRNLYSICEGDYSGALLELAQAIQNQIPPTCFPLCVADVDAATELVEVNCEVYEEDLLQQTRVPVIECEEVDGVWVVPAGNTICYAPRIDKGGQTPSPLDDMSPVCVEEGFNLEFEIVRVGVKPVGTTLSATCELSGDKAKDCPNL